MSKLLFQRCAAALLAATYLVVGATGESLYYLIESPQAVVAAADELARGYAHDHGDGLWHHHGHAHGPAQDQDGTASAGTDRGEGLSNRGESRHDDHTTLLLAIASEIELSVLTPLPLAEAPRLELAIGSASVGSVPARSGASLGPRGPPAGGLV